MPVATTGAGSNGVSWSPAVIPSSRLVLWLDAAGFAYADAGTTPAVDTGRVQQLTDRSGNNRHVTQTTTASQPTWHANVIGGQGVCRFDGVDDSLRRTATTLLSSVNNFAICGILRSRGDSFSDSTRFFGANTSPSTDLVVTFDAGKPCLRVAAGEPAARSDTVITGTTRAWRFTAVANGSADTITVSDGTAAGTPRSQAFDPFTMSTDACCFGAMNASGPSSFCPLDLGEWLIVTEPTAGELTGIASYLQAKWGVS